MTTTLYGMMSKKLGVHSVIRTITVLLLWQSLSFARADHADIHQLKTLVGKSQMADTSQVSACYELAKYYLYDSTSQAQLYASRGIEIANNLDFPAGRGHCENILAMAYELLGYLDEALTIYESAFNSLSKAGLLDNAAGIMVNMGVVHYYAGNRGEALKYYLRALQYARNHALTVQESKLLNNIAVIYRELKQYPQAIQIYLQSLQLLAVQRDSLAYANTLENLGLAYSYLNQGEKAVAYLKQAIGWYRVADFKSEANQGQLSLAQVYLQLGKIDAAQEILTALLKNEEVRLLPHYKATCHLMLARIKFDQSDYHQAQQYLNNGFLLIENSNRNELKSRYLALYAELNREMGDYEKALEYTMERMAILDTLNQSDRLATEREMRAKFDLQEKEARLIIQEQKILQQLRERGWFTALLLISSLLVLVLAFFTFSKSRSNRMLREKNKIIDESLREKEILLREIHHRVKNNLQVVSSLLSLQARSLKGKEALEALAKGKDRVRSMALIHQNLYQEEHLKGVNSREYINRLCRSLLNSYCVGEGKIQLRTEVEPLLLDIDTVIPLGLILNELMTNAIKYAFKPEEMGEISISLAQNNDILQLVVSDNGIGMPAGSIGSKQTMGYRLIQSFVQKLKGTYDISIDHGTRVAFSFRTYSRSI